MGAAGDPAPRPGPANTALVMSQRRTWPLVCANLRRTSTAAAPLTDTNDRGRSRH